MEKILAENVKRICKAQGKQLKDLAREMGVDPASLTRAMNGNARLDTIEKMAFALGVSASSLLEPTDVVEGFINIGGKIYHFKSMQELDSILQIRRSGSDLFKNRSTINSTKEIDNK